MSETNSYEEKKQGRIERLREKADNARLRSSALHDDARGMASVIPFGQPILVGHHSEKRDRSYRNRIHNKFGKAVEETKKAEYYENRARVAESNRTISSDDPEAMRKLKAKIEKAEKRQKIMKAANSIVRSKPKNEPTPEKIKKLSQIEGCTEETAHRLFSPDFAGRVGFPSYELTNNSANIRRMKDRLGSLEKLASAEHKETSHEGFQVVENPEENRIQLFFDSKQTYFDLCKNKGINLRSYGLRYSRATTAWQRHLNNAGRWAVERAVADMTKEG